MAKSVEKMLIPVLDYAKSKEENKLIIYGVEIEDPLSSANEYVNDFNASPPFGLFDIFNHLIYSSTEHDKQGLAAYKVLNICMRKYNENAMFVRLFRITLHVLPPVGQLRKRWIGLDLTCLSALKSYILMVPHQIVMT